MSLLMAVELKRVEELIAAGLIPKSPLKYTLLKILNELLAILVVEKNNSIIKYWQDQEEENREYWEDQAEKNKDQREENGRQHQDANGICKVTITAYQAIIVKAWKGVLFE